MSYLLSKRRYKNDDIGVPPVNIMLQCELGMVDRFWTPSPIYFEHMFL